MSERVYRQLQNAVPNADTPAQTATLRTALRFLVDDTEYDLSDADREWIQGWLGMAAWSDGTRQALTTVALRWAQGKPWLETLRQSLTTRAGEGATPQPHQEKEPEHDNYTTRTGGHPMALTGEHEQRLARVLTSMQTEPYWFPEDFRRLESAAEIYRSGRVRCDTAGMYHVTGSGSPKAAKIYQIDKECSCEFARKNGRTKWCQHLIATVIYRKMLAPFRNDVEPALFAPTKTVEERFALPPRAPEEEWPPGGPSEAPQGTIMPQDREGDIPVSETLVEAPSDEEEGGVQEDAVLGGPPGPALALRLTRRPISVIIADLSRALPPECIASLPKAGANIQFLRWHTVAAVLDAYAPGWEGAVVRVEKIGEKCAVTYRITIPAAEGLCSREDSGMEDEDKDDYGDAMTNAIATAFKRAAAKFGVGRGLYDTHGETEKFTARLRGDREQLLKTIEEKALRAGIPQDKLVSWLMSHTGAYHRNLLPVWALRSVLAQLEALPPGVVS
jgi:hypothetical protein